MKYHKKVINLLEYIDTEKLFGYNPDNTSGGIYRINRIWENKGEIKAEIEFSDTKYINIERGDINA